MSAATRNTRMFWNRAPIPCGNPPDANADPGTYMFMLYCIAPCFWVDITLQYAILWYTLQLLSSLAQKVNLSVMAVVVVLYLPQQLNARLRPCLPPTVIAYQQLKD